MSPRSTGATKTSPPEPREVVLQLAQRFLRRPGWAGLSLRRLQFLEARPRLVRHVLRVGQPQIFALGQGGFTPFQQPLVLLVSDLVPARVYAGRPHVQVDHLGSHPGRQSAAPPGGRHISLPIAAPHPIRLAPSSRAPSAQAVAGTTPRFPSHALLEGDARKRTIHPLKCLNNHQ